MRIADKKVRAPLSQPVKDIRRDGRPNQHEQPNAACKNIVIVQEPAPGMSRDEMPEQKFECKCHDQPEKAHGPGLFG
jgi:hypothetical protein